MGDASHLPSVASCSKVERVSTLASAKKRKGVERKHAHYAEVHRPDHRGVERVNQGRKHRANAGDHTREAPALGSVLLRPRW